MVVEGVHKVIHYTKEVKKYDCYKQDNYKNTRINKTEPFDNKRFIWRRRWDLILHTCRNLEQKRWNLKCSTRRNV